MLGDCPTPGCTGIGHVKGAKYTGHHRYSTTVQVSLAAIVKSRMSDFCQCFSYEIVVCHFLSLCCFLLREVMYRGCRFSAVVTLGLDQRSYSTLRSVSAWVGEPSLDG